MAPKPCNFYPVGHWLKGVSSPHPLAQQRVVPAPRAVLHFGQKRSCAEVAGPRAEGRFILAATNPGGPPLAISSTASQAVAKAMEAQTPEEWKQTFLDRQKIKGSGWAIVEEIDDPRRKI